MAEKGTAPIQRWTAKRRSSLVMSILKGETTVREAARKHGLTVAEVERWKERFQLGAESEHLVVRMANENRRWGYTRIRDAIHSLGYLVSRRTVKRILEEYGIELAPERGRRTDWRSFLRVSCWDCRGVRASFSCSRPA